MINAKRENAIDYKDGRIYFDKTSIKSAIYSLIQSALDDETRRAKQEMNEELENAIKQMVEIQKSLIKKIVEDEKQAILVKEVDALQFNFIKPLVIKENITWTDIPDKSIANLENVYGLSSDTNFSADFYKEKAELEILPPWDQYEIDSINKYLNEQPEVMKVEQVTLLDKSIFEVELREPIDFIEKLGSLPQVLNAEALVENGQKKIKIVLNVKSKLEQNHDEMNEKVNKIVKMIQADPRLRL